MKKTLKCWIVLCVAILSVAVVSACRKDAVQDTGEHLTITVGAGGVSTSAEFISGVLDELADSGELHVVYGADTGYGKWLKEIGSLIPDASSEYIALYVTTDDMRHIDPLTKLEVDGVTYYYALKGVDQMPAIDGVTYLFVLESFA